MNQILHDAIIGVQLLVSFQCDTPSRHNAASSRA
jgi:hypothetical protein